MKYRLSVLLILCYLLAGCGGTTESTSSTDILIPLASGNKWIYDHTAISVTGDTVSVVTDTSFVGLATVLNGNYYYFFNHLRTLAITPSNIGTGLTTDGIRIVRNGVGGVWIFDELANLERLTFQYPSATGAKYMVFSDSSAAIFDGPIISEYIQTMATNDKIVTAKNTFSCYHYQVTLELVSERGPKTSEVMLEFFIAPGVGIVKLIMPGGGQINSTTTQIWELKDYFLE